jgi:oligosaccharide repeat unit polymerase
MVKAADVLGRDLPEEFRLLIKRVVSSRDGHTNAADMTIVLLTFWAIGMVILARWICGGWVNHLSLYSFVWTVSLLTLQMRLIAYHHVVFEAWMYVFVAWVSLYLGTALIRLKSPPAKLTFPSINMKRLRNAIFVLGAAGLISTVVLALNIVRKLDAGLLQALLENGNQIYGMRYEGEVSGLMYLNFLPYAGCVLAGIYTARLGKITLTAAMPLAAMLLDGIVSMQRAGFFVGAVLLFLAYLFTPKASKLHVPIWQKITAVSVVLVVFLLVTASRGGALSVEGETQALVDAGDSVSVLPSLYFYASGPVAGFSEYLKHPEQDGRALWGRYMFASVYRFLSKFGTGTYVPYYPNYYYTPVPINACTYLREIHFDFGGTAIFFFPFCLGLLVTLLETCQRSMFSIILLSFLYLVVLFSFDLNFISGGGWYFPLPIALLVAAAVKVRKVRRAGGLYSI